MNRTLSDDQLSVIADAAYGCDGMDYCEECSNSKPEDAPCEVCDPDGWDAYLDEVDREHRASLGHEIYFVAAPPAR